MVSLDWTSINPYVQIKDTRKKLFDRFFSSIRYNCPGGRLILKPATTEVIQRGIYLRKTIAMQYNYGGSWRSTNEQADKIDVTQLLDFQDIRSKYGDAVRMRVEEPRVSFYAENESVLYDIAKNDLWAWGDSLEMVTRPRSEESRALLESGAIITKKDINYQYKIILRDGKFANKATIGKYLDNLGQDVKVSRAVSDMLKSTNPFIWGAWFYTNDATLSTTLSLIEPGIILNIHPVIQSNK